MSLVVRLALAVVVLAAAYDVATSSDWDSLVDLGVDLGIYTDEPDSEGR